MELTEYTSKVIDPVVEEVYDQVQQVSHMVHAYMKRKHAGVHDMCTNAVAHDVIMHVMEFLHDDPYAALEARLEQHEVEEWAENAYLEYVEGGD